MPTSRAGSKFIRWGAWPLALLLALSAACTPESPSARGDDGDLGIRMGNEGNGGAGGPVIVDATVPIGGAGGEGNAAGDGAGGMGGDGMGGAGGGIGGMSGMGGDEGMGGAGGELPRECDTGLTRCPEQDADFREFCNVDGQWALQQCPEGTICIGLDCAPDPADCTPGERICLPDGLPAICQPPQWVSEGPCPDGLVCGGGVCQTPLCAAAAQRQSYQGCEYLAADFPNLTFEPGSTEGTPSAPWGIVVANVDGVNDTEVSIYDARGEAIELIGNTAVAVPLDFAGNFAPSRVQSEVRDADGMIVDQGMNLADAVVIPPGGLATFLVPRRMGPLTRSSVQADAVRVRSSSPVVAYQFSPYCCNYSFSNDASLLVPTTALGNRYRWLGVPMLANPLFPDAGRNSVMAIMAPEDLTSVSVSLPAGAMIQADNQGRIRQVGQQVDLRLDANEVALIHTQQGFGFGQENTDLSGALIESDRPVAVFSSHVCTNYPQNLPACDHLQEQLFPIDTWGRSFQLVPTKLRGQVASEVTYWKLMAGDLPANITLGSRFADLRAARPGFTNVVWCGDRLQGADVIRLQPGEVCEFGTQRPVQAISDTPVAVMGILSGQDSTGLLGQGTHAGDPAIFLVPPDRQFRRDYIFLTPATYFSDYVTIVTPAGNELVLDGQPVDLAAASPIGGSPYQYIHVELDDGVHTIAGRAPFGIVVYAYDDYVSYAFTGGLNLTK